MPTYRLGLSLSRGQALANPAPIISSADRQSENRRIGSSSGFQHQMLINLVVGWKGGRDGLKCTGEKTRTAFVGECHRRFFLEQVSPDAGVIGQISPCCLIAQPLTKHTVRSFSLPVEFSRRDGTGLRHGFVEPELIAKEHHGGTHRGSDSSIAFPVNAINLSGSIAMQHLPRSNWAAFVGRLFAAVKREWME